MKQLLFQIGQISDRVFNRSYGWTGVDIGCHAVHMAQVRRRGNSWLLAAIWTVEHPEPYKSEATLTPLDDETFGWLTPEAISEHGLAPTLDYLKSLNTLFRGCDCAATLSDGVIDYREMELPQCEPSESLSIVQSEIALETECEPEELIAGCWPLPSNGRDATTIFGASSIKGATALLLANDLLAAGFECQTLDAVPCAMARATSMVVENSELTTLAIDLGYKQATMTLVQDGMPILSRGIRSLGILPLLEQIAKSFAITVSDAQTLLFQASDSRSGLLDLQSQFTNPLQQLLNHYMHLFASEVDKTIAYSNRTFRGLTPSHLLLMGEGARIACAEQELANRIGLPTQSWGIELSSNLFGEQHIASFAIAAGLSALAWEET